MPVCLKTDIILECATHHVSIEPSQYHCGCECNGARKVYQGDKQILGTCCNNLYHMIVMYMFMQPAITFRLQLDFDQGMFHIVIHNLLSHERFTLHIEEHIIHPKSVHFMSFSSLS